jgi:hypothetical protein
MVLSVCIVTRQECMAAHVRGAIVLCRVFGQNKEVATLGVLCYAGYVWAESNLKPGKELRAMQARSKRMPSDSLAS